MNMSRGTGFVELYIKPFVLGAYDWDILSEGLHWVEDVFPLFNRARMHGGNPRKGDVYGYTAWNKKRGYVSIHNPSEKKVTYSFTLDRDFGLTKDAKAMKYFLSSPMVSDEKGLKSSYKYGETITIELEPREIRILNFDDHKRNWSKLRELQERTPFVGKDPESEKKVTKNHPVLGTWSYQAGSTKYSREFTKDSICILRRGNKIIWEKPFKVLGNKINVSGYRHVIKKDGTMLIENCYKATKN
ncbi:hypothetical protein AAEX28_01300 [Lentisphaerota bacterium WC36G]|nr:hypothetical protein LJT99_04185 [Lentisphaerae bacterium WC36]